MKTILHGTETRRDGEMRERERDRYGQSLVYLRCCITFEFRLCKWHTTRYKKENISWIYKYFEWETYLGNHYVKGNKTQRKKDKLVNENMMTKLSSIIIPKWSLRKKRSYKKCFHLATSKRSGSTNDEFGGQNTVQRSEKKRFRREKEMDRERKREIGRER